MSRATTTVAFFAVIGASVHAGAQTPPAQAPEAAPPAAPAPSAAPPPPPEGGPPPEYYVETPGQEGTPREAAPPPPPPGPLRASRSTSRRRLGPARSTNRRRLRCRATSRRRRRSGSARASAGSSRSAMFTRNVQVAPYTVYEGIPWSDFASSGPMFEVDAGMRLSRSYNVFVLWERARARSRATPT